MSLEKFQGGGGFHFRRDDAQQVILNADNIDGTQAVPACHNLKRTCKTLVLSLLPMEILSDDNIVEHKGRLGEHCRKSVLPEIQFIVQGSVVLNLAFLKRGLSRTGPVGKYFEHDLLRGHYPDFQYRLGAGQPPDDETLVLLCEGNLGKHL